MIKQGKSNFKVEKMHQNVKVWSVGIEQMSIEWLKRNEQLQISETWVWCTGVGKSTFLCSLDAIFMASFCKLSFGRRCRPTTKSIEGPTSTNSILGIVVPDLFSLMAHCVNNTVCEAMAVHTKARSTPARFKLSTTCTDQIHTFFHWHSVVVLQKKIKVITSPLKRSSKTSFKCFSSSVLSKPSPMKAKNGFDPICGAIVLS